MSLARAFTKRLTRSESKRPKISAPSLITSTNAASYNAPNVTSAHRIVLHSQDVALCRSSSSNEIEKGEVRSENPTPTLTDGSSAESSPSQSPVLEHNHLSCYFPGPTNAPMKPQPTKVAPIVPNRSPSHSKREHERLSRARSFRSSTGLGSVASMPNSSSISARNSSECTLSSPTGLKIDSKAGHPFSLELEKLNEIAEEFEKGSRLVEKHIDESVMEQLGLARFGAEDYIVEIASLSAQRFDDIANNDGDQWKLWI